jgi:hypothetical protein
MYREAAISHVLKYYYLLPNNGMHNYGVNSCQSRYNEAITCALIDVKHTIIELESLLLKDDNSMIKDRIDFYKEVETELYKIEITEKIKEAHSKITKIKGKEYAPTSYEIQEVINKQLKITKDEQ